MPEINFKKQWYLILISLFAIFLSAEFLLRVVGYTPALMEDIDLWAQRRALVDNARNKNHLVVLGASRSRTNISPKIFYEMFPEWRLTGLGITGKQLYYGLKDISENSNFTGNILLFMITEDENILPTEGQKRHTIHYHENYSKWWCWNIKLNRRIKSFLQNHFVLAFPPVSSIFRSLEYQSIAPRGTLSTLDGFSRHYFHKQPDEFKKNILQKSDYEFRTEEARWEKSNITDFDRKIEPYVEIISRIQKRGGKIAVIFPPIKGWRKIKSEKIYPKDIFWTHLIRKLGISYTIHYGDLPRYNQLKIPDGSHLTPKDAKIFTKDILKILKEQGYFDD